MNVAGKSNAVSNNPPLLRENMQATKSLVGKSIGVAVNQPLSRENTQAPKSAAGKSIGVAENRPLSPENVQAPKSFAGKSIAVAENPPLSRKNMQAPMGVAGKSIPVAENPLLLAENMQDFAGKLIAVSENRPLSRENTQTPPLWNPKALYPRSKSIIGFRSVITIGWPMISSNRRPELVSKKDPNQIEKERNYMGISAFQASNFREQKKILDLYIELARYLRLVSDTIQFHRDFPVLLTEERESLRKKFSDVLKEARSLKPEFLRQVDKSNKAHAGAQQHQLNGLERTASGSETSLQRPLNKRKASPSLDIKQPIITAPQSSWKHNSDHHAQALLSKSVHIDKNLKKLGPSITGIGQSSNSETKAFMCGICVEPKPLDKSFNINGCTHSFCTDCMVKYVASKLQENFTCIQCPVSNCNGLLEPEYCCAILPSEVFKRWGNALCESSILGSQKFYCPFKDCSALLVNDGEEIVTQSECPNCWRLFCAQCKTSWHAGIDCAEFQKSNRDERERQDIMMMELAKNKNWKRCPNCRFYVEKTSGCMYMKCRCGSAFCYNCGAPSTQKSHLCSKCMH